MKRKTMKMEKLNDEELKIADLLTSCGFDLKSAKVLVSLWKNEFVTSKGLQLSLELQQPEISIIMGKLRNMGLVSQKKIRGRGKGRPYFKYSMMVSMKDFVSSIEAKAVESQKYVLDRLSQLKRLANAIGC